MKNGERGQEEDWSALASFCNMLGYSPLTIICHQLYADRVYWIPREIQNLNFVVCYLILLMRFFLKIILIDAA